MKNCFSLALIALAFALMIAASMLRLVSGLLLIFSFFPGTHDIWVLALFFYLSGEGARSCGLKAGKRAGLEATDAG